MKNLLTLTLLVTGATLCISPANASEKPCEQKTRHEIKDNSSNKGCNNMAKAREKMKKRYDLQKNKENGVHTQNSEKKDCNKGCDMMNKGKKEMHLKTNELESKCKNGDEESCSRMKKFTKRITNKIHELRGKCKNGNAKPCSKTIIAEEK